MIKPLAFMYHVRSVSNCPRTSLPVIQTLPTYCSPLPPLTRSSRRKDPPCLGRGGRGEVSWHLQAWFLQAGRGGKAVDTFIKRSYHILRRAAGGERVVMMGGAYMPKVGPFQQTFKEKTLTRKF